MKREKKHTHIQTRWRIKLSHAALFSSDNFKYGLCMSCVTVVSLMGVLFHFNVSPWAIYMCPLVAWMYCALSCNNSSHSLPLTWRHNERDGVSNRQPHHCLLNRLFRRRSKKTSKLRVTGLCVGNSPGPVNSPHKWPVTRKMFPFDDVIMMLFSLMFFSTLVINFGMFETLAFRLRVFNGVIRAY